MIHKSMSLKYEPSSEPLQVREACSRDKDEMFVIISASAKRQKHVAEIMGQRGLLKLRSGPWSVGMSFWAS